MIERLEGTDALRICAYDFRGGNVAPPLKLATNLQERVKVRHFRAYAVAA